MKHLLSIIFSLAIVVVGFNVGFQSDPAANNIVPEPVKLTPIVVKAVPIETVVVDPYAGLDVDQVHCLAKNIYFEARGETTDGKMAVANVTMNRVASARFPDSICGVVEQAVYSRWWMEHHDRLVPVRWKCQFTWFCDGKSDNIKLTDSKGNTIQANMSAWQESLAIAIQAIKHEIPDITNGATHYYNPSLADPHWAPHYRQVAQIENHRFYRK